MSVPVLHESDRLLALVNRHQIRGAELIVLAPASPVLHFLKELIELRGVARRAAGVSRLQGEPRQKRESEK